MATCDDSSFSSTEHESGSDPSDAEAEDSLKNGSLMSCQILIIFGLIFVKISSELADIPLGELQEIRQKLGTKKFDSMMKKSLEDRETRSFKRANKNR
jgi:hypothetical protein